MKKRTSLLLDDESQTAARQLALHYSCSVSEAIRRAILTHRETALGVSAATRQERREVLRRLFGLFEGNDPREEVRRLKSEDAGF